MATVLYARVSSTEQTIEHQRTQAEQAGFKLDEVIWDSGVSGVSTKLAERPQGRRLFDLLRNSDTLIVRWVDRLGRNYEDICETIREFMRRGVVIRTVINGITFDGATKMPCSAPSVTLRSPSWPRRRKRKPKQRRKRSEPASPTPRPMRTPGPIRDASPATAANSSRARKRCSANPQGWRGCEDHGAHPADGLQDQG